MPRQNRLSIPMALAGLQGRVNSPAIVLGADIGGTKTNLAVYEALNGILRLKHKAVYPSAEQKSVTAMLDEFLEKTGASPQRFCLAVAGPVIRGKAKLTNLPYAVVLDEITAHYRHAEVAVINDLESTAYGLPQLKEDELIDLVDPLTGEEDFSGGNMAILAPGTGLGEAGLFWDGQFYRPFATEGGHCDFSPRSELDIELLQYLQKKFGVVSWERVLSGPGITLIHEFLAEEKKVKFSSEHAKKIEELRNLPKELPAIISSAAIAGTEPICIETMQLFVQYLARESSNLVLKMKATGGIFLGGGIPPKILPLLQGDYFQEAFRQAGVMKHLVEKVPVRIIDNDRAALLGAGNFAAYGHG